MSTFQQDLEDFIAKKKAESDPVESLTDLKKLIESLSATMDQITSALQVPAP
jgi:hypothetical protein